MIKVSLINLCNSINLVHYNSLGQVDTQQIGAQPVVDTDYNARGDMTRLTDQAGAQTQFAHDDRGLVTTRTDALGKATTSTYNALGLLTNQTDRNGDTSTISYTPTSKVETLTYPTRAGTITHFEIPGFAVNFSYDNKDRLTTMVDQHGSTTNSYDALDRLIGHTDPNGYTVQYVYDEASNITQLTYPNGKTVSYQYDNLNRVSNVSIDWLNKSAQPNFDAAGRLMGITHFNDTSTTYQFDNANRLTGLTHYKGNNTAFADYQYTLDANGNRTQAVITNEPIQPAGLINGVSSKAYNAQKNRITAAVTHEPITIDYDDKGQIEIMQGDTTSSGYGFDAAGRVTYYATIDQFSTYQYDGAGNRISATRSDPEDAGIQITRHYVHDASGNLLAELNEQGQVQKYFIYGLGLMAMVDATTNQVYTYHFDGTGHTVAMTNNNQQITHRYAYSPYGLMMAKEEAVNQPFTYAGQVGIYTEADGVYYMRARYYDAKLRQFISVDPAGFSGGINLYAYAAGNPIYYVDPNGELPQSVVDFSAGLGDALLLGQGGRIRDALGIGGVNTDSGAYTAGAIVSFAAGGSRLAYAGAAKAGSILAPTAEAASNFRNGIKAVGRLKLAPNFRRQTYAGLRQQGKTNAQIRAKAGRTNRHANTAGAQAGIGGAIVLGK